MEEEEESCSWVTRSKFSPTVYIRSGSSGLPSITYEDASDRSSELVEEQLIDESKPGYTGSVSSSVISVSEANKIGATLDSPQHSNSTKTAPKSGSETKDSSKSSHTLKDSESQTVDFSFHPHSIITSNSKESSTPDSSVAFLNNSSRQRHNQSPSVSQTVDLSFNSDISTGSNSPKDSNVVFSDPFSFKSSSSHHVQSLTQMLKETNFQNIDFSFHSGRGCQGGGRGDGEKWRVDLSELYLGARFASGAHSRLYHGRYKNQPVAVKIIRIPDDEEDGVMGARLEKQFARETTFLSYLSHRNVIKLAGAREKSPIFFIITEYLHGGSLRAFLRKLDHSPLPLDMLISIALEVARGMEYIHSQGVIHRDLKPENILFDHNFCVKIADFGVACEEAYCDELEDDAGTYRWMAPEMIKHRPYGRKVDVYSFGLLLWEMNTGAIPYEDMSPVQAAFAVVNKNIRPTIPGDCSVVLRALIEQCWSTFPEKRPEFRQIVKFLKQYESDLASGESLEQIENLTIKDYKKSWVERLRPATKR
ncbi:Serine/threonine-protein kinase HT1 [Platanthera guangdongensis]|uniref:Serine/threonine-protein kinase HT1 n=1 Tax=Platanthera guangdongensis TaxID=2320717 RepID=A0ABR2M461_9ASPA